MTETPFIILVAGTQRSEPSAVHYAKAEEAAKAAQDFLLAGSWVHYDTYLQQVLSNRANRAAKAGAR